MWFWRMLRKHWKMAKESECRWEKRTAEWLQQKERGNPGVTASLLPQLPLRSVGGWGWGEGGREWEMKRWKQEQGDEEKDRKEFRDRLIYEFLFLSHDIFREFNVVSHPSFSPSVFPSPPCSVSPLFSFYSPKIFTQHVTLQIVVLLAKSF